MSDDQCHELEDIAKMLVEAREKLEKLQSSRNLSGTDTLHAAISHAQRLCHRIYDGTPPQTGQTSRAVCVH